MFALPNRANRRVLTELQKCVSQMRFGSCPAEGRSSSFTKCWRSKSLSSRSRLMNFCTTDLHLCHSLFHLHCTLTLPSLWFCAARVWRTCLPAPPMTLCQCVGWVSLSCTAQTPDQKQTVYVNVGSCVSVYRHIYPHLHSSLHEAGWQTCQRSNVSSIAGLTDPFFQLIQEHQLIPIHCCLQSLKAHTVEVTINPYWDCVTVVCLPVPEETAGQRKAAGPAGANCGS